MVFPMQDGSSGEGTPTAHARLTRRAILCGTGAALGLSLTGHRARHVAAHGDSATTGEVANVAFPPDVGQADLRVYVPETGHTLRGSFLDYWRATGAAAVFGNPVSEPFAAANGYYSQAFENVVFQYRPEFFDTHDPIMRPMPIGRMALQPLDTADGGGRAVKRYRLLARVQRPLRPEDDDVLRVIDAGGLYDETTGHTVSGEILAGYRFNEGSFYLGSPLTEPYDEGGGAVQYFEGGLLVTSENGVGLAPLAKELGPQLGIDTMPVEQADLPPYDETLFWTADNPNLVGDPDALGPKWAKSASACKCSGSIRGRRSSRARESARDWNRMGLRRACSTSGSSTRSRTCGASPMRRARCSALERPVRGPFRTRSKTFRT